MNIFNRIGVKLGRSQLNLTSSKTVNEADGSTGVVESTSTSTSDPDVSTEIIQPSEIEFLRSTVDYLDDEESSASNKIKSDREKVVERISGYNKSRIINEFLNLVDEKDHIIEELTNENTQLNENIEEYKRQEESQILSLKSLVDDKSRLQGTIDSLIGEIELDNQISYRVQEEIFDVAKFLQVLLKSDKQSLTMEINKQKQELQNFLDGKASPCCQTPLSCRILLPYLELIGERHVELEKIGLCSYNMLQQYISVFDSLLFGLRKIIDKNTSTKLDQLGQLILHNKTKLQYTKPNIEIENRCAQLGVDEDIGSYCKLMQQVIMEIDEFKHKYKEKN